MRILTLIALFALSPLAFAQGRSWEATLEKTFQGSRLILDLSAGGYEIQPVPEGGKIRVRWATKFADQMPDAKVQLEIQGSEARLRTRAPKDDFRVVIEVPARLDLEARLSVGELAVKGIQGHKDLRCRVGEISVAVPDVQAYGRAEAAVKIGEISATPFGGGKDGFFRSWRWEGKGAYRLEARVGIGEVRFE